MAVPLEKFVQQLEESGIVAGDTLKEFFPPKVKPVSLKLSNPLGLFDMHRNVQEWCQDFFDEKWYETSAVPNPQGPSSGSNHVIRGGFWYSTASSCRSAFRHSSSPSNRAFLIGFRIVRVIDTSTD